MLRALQHLPVPLPLVVTARLADEYLWAEVLHEGGYDVLAQPFAQEEVLRVISAAARRSHNACHQARHPSLTFTAGI